jgi:hypothetical protein
MKRMDKIKTSKPCPKRLAQTTKYIINLVMQKSDTDKICLSRLSLGAYQNYNRR